MLGMALPTESGINFDVSLDADNQLYSFESPPDLIVTGHELFMKIFFWTPKSKPVTISMKECQSAKHGETYLRVLIGSMFTPLQIILTEIEDLISAQSAGEANSKANLITAEGLANEEDFDFALEVATIDSACAVEDIALAGPGGVADKTTAEAAKSAADKIFLIDPAAAVKVKPKEIEKNESKIADASGGASKLEEPGPKVEPKVEKTGAAAEENESSNGL